MFSDRGYPSNHDSPESDARFGMMFAELWHDWFETMSQVAFQTHRACEFMLDNGGPADRRRDPFDAPFWRSKSDGPNGAIDMDRLKECLQAMEPMQAARVMHAVQMVQAMEAMLKRKRSRADETAPW